MGLSTNIQHGAGCRSPAGVPNALSCLSCWALVFLFTGCSSSRDVSALLPDELHVSTTAGELSGDRFAEDGYPLTKDRSLWSVTVGLVWRIPNPDDEAEILRDIRDQLIRKDTKSNAEGY